jgi:hypothetical protein
MHDPLSESYRELALYTREHDARLRDIQEKVIEAYGPDGANNFDLLALMGWALYELRRAGVPVGNVLALLAYQSRCVDIAQQGQQS